MDIKKTIELLKSLPEDTGLNYAEHWDDDFETQTWRKDTIAALEFAVKALQESDVVGTLIIDGKEYKVTK